jgi:hypothetical protein
VVFDMIQAVIKHAYPKLVPSTMLSDMPNWDEYSKDIEVEATILRSEESYHLQWSN